MSKFDLWISMIRAVTRTALLKWNGQLVGSLVFPASSNVQIKFVSSVNPPRFQSKTVLWTLAEVFDVYNNERHYSDSFFKTQIGRSPDSQVLGVASIKSALSASTGSSPSAPLNRTVPGQDYHLPRLDTASNQSLLFNKYILSPDSYAQGLTLVLNYLDGGAIFNPRTFFGLTISLLIYSAQHDQKMSPSGPIHAYNSIDNYTYSITHTSEAATENLTWQIAIAVMGLLPSEMLGHGQGHGGQWAELNGRIKLDNAYVGRLQIVKGDQRGHPGASCMAENSVVL